MSDTNWVPAIGTVRKIYSGALLGPEMAEAPQRFDMATFPNFERVSLSKIFDFGGRSSLTSTNAQDGAGVALASVGADSQRHQKNLITLELESLALDVAKHGHKKKDGGANGQQQFGTGLQASDKCSGAEWLRLDDYDSASIGAAVPGGGAASSSGGADEKDTGNAAVEQNTIRGLGVQQGHVIKVVDHHRGVIEEGLYVEELINNRRKLIGITRAHQQGESGEGRASLFNRSFISIC